ncbi:MAG TPA: MBOAT family protein, partial [bacterium]|nr:MBOAT family protein [bacterium]
MAMLFNSFEFLIFFTILFLLYISLGHRWRNYLLLIGSYIFYGSWDWRFLSLLIISTGLDYFCGLRIDAESSDAKRKRYLVISVCGNLLILGFFKYFNFFAENLTELLSFFNLTIRPLYLDIILPVGISFYTFQTMSYSIDVYRREIKPTRNFLDFALFVSFFPQLVAGPIERAKHLLPQILGERSVTLEKFYDGAAFIFWGLFQKVYVADNLAALVDPVFESRSLSGFSYMIAGY